MVVIMWGKEAEENNGGGDTRGTVNHQLLCMGCRRSDGHYTWACQLIYATGSVWHSHVG